MAVPTLYIDTGGTALGSGSTDTTNPTHSSTINSVTVAVAGTTVTFSGAIDIAAVPNDGSATIFINDATNTNQKIFQITAVDDTLDTVTVSVAPTGVIATSTWGIGGQFVYASASFEASMVAGWTAIINNSPAAKSADFFTSRAAGSSALGVITLKGKSGVRPVLNVTNTTQCLESGQSTWHFENLELDQNGASGNVVAQTGGNGSTYRNIKIVDGGGVGMNFSQTGNYATECDIANCGGDGLNSAAATCGVFGCYIHDNGADGIENSSANPGNFLWNILDTNAGRGFLWSGAVALASSQSLFLSNTIYGNGNSGIEIADGDSNLLLFNNICMNNGNAAGEYNVEWVAGTAELFSYHAYNLFYQDAGTLATGALNLLSLTTNSTESTADPLFTNAGSGDFSLGSTSPAKATGYPGAFITGSTGYLDMGAVQRQESGSSTTVAFNLISTHNSPGGMVPYGNI